MLCVVVGNPLFASLTRRDVIEGGASARVKLWARAIGSRDIVAGISPTIDSIAGVANSRTIADLPSSPFGTGPSMVVVTSRPLTSIAHELGHTIGRKHAGQNCDGTRPGEQQVGEAWPPDDQGLLQGVGLDLWGIAPTSPAFVPSAAKPYRVIARDLKGSAAEFYDLMSYCAATDEVPSASNFPDPWLSPRGWDAEVDALQTYTKRTGGATGVAPLRAARVSSVGPKATVAAVESLNVTALARARSAIIVDVQTGPGAPQPAVAGGLALVGYGASGTEVARAGLTDDESSDTGLHTYSGALPAAGVARVAIVAADGSVLTDRTQSPNAPAVTITAPRARQTVGGRHAVRVAWRAKDADGGTLVSSAEVSTDGGRVWRLIYQGPKSSTSLPAAYFTASRRTRIRVRVSDGFRSTTARSATFRTLRPPASVRIDAPRTRIRLASDATLRLSGSASTVVGQVPSNRLVWTFAGQSVARGRKTTLRNLPPGRRKLTLTVRGDPKARASVTLNVRDSTPRFLKATLPRRIGRSARRFTVRLRSGTNATVRAGGRSVRIKARRRGVLRVPVRPGRGPVLVTFTVRALGGDYAFTRVVKR